MGHYIPNNLCDLKNIFSSQRGMNKQHQAGFSQLFRVAEPLLWAHLRTECFLHVDLAAATGKTGYASGGDFVQSAVTIPASTQRCWSDAGVILIVGMTNVGRDHGNTKSRNSRQVLGQNRGILSTTCNPYRQLS